MPPATGRRWGWGALRQQHELAELAAGGEALVCLRQPRRAGTSRRRARAALRMRRAAARGARARAPSAAFSSSGRARSVEAISVPRLHISFARFSSPFAPAPIPITTMRPLVASASRFASRLGAPTSSRITSNGPCCSKPSGSIAVAPSAATSSRLSGLRTVAVTRAPTLLPSWIAAVPTPPAPPCTSSRSPACRPACVKSASCAVVKTSGNPPAAGQSSWSGTGISTRSWTTASSACPPPPTIAITRSPVWKRVAPGTVGERPRPPARGRGCPAASPAAPGSARASASCRRR